ncbi:biotin transporter BioY [Sporosarcina thermotolerans]|uniref:Biotin transporter n=1 Tax=Sporosarcina thermotolerans TaxID=633404 RepID=A0AAW9AAN2_9BACL|nr:biotin transporter BioY [Sporosarcina thermotolerans]MDW0116713.1 biotin transporter BioY [Sporosarcina thermotolerans]WHT48905.1 biotin transporter BioY [Sporosarcina thermotolerans]
MTTASVKTKTGMSAFSIVYCGMFAALMMIGANITWFVPFLVIGGVPITLQTFFAVLAGLLLGSRLGAISMTVYMFAGLAGAPIFSKFQGGFGFILVPTFGFVVSFILVAFVAGKIVEKYGSLRSYVVAGLVALVINYVIGTNWMYFAYKLWAAAPDAFSYGVAWMWMVPPLPKDILLSILAGIFGHRMYKVLRVRRTI